ncbi:MAG TPA: hypothetical protein ENK47_00925 [Euryarchaeota archaeon]|nr:MAG: hypothetical protein B6U90_05235 [Thermoplasmatales archaeon ex4484_6]RLF68853.1 MAG: hypothetical protein DRN57_02675 [Thermoplasmata archaeon]HHD15252.1 hypothetical protein [Euryarchaeota archaeon]
MEEEIVEEQERRGFGGWLRSLFSRKSEEDTEQEEEVPEYKRRLLDGRIEKYLDQNLDAYIQEYGILTGLDLEAYEERYNRLTGRISNMTEYMADADVKVSVLENDLAEIGKVSKKK